MSCRILLTALFLTSFHSGAPDNLQQTWVDIYSTDGQSSLNQPATGDAFDVPTPSEVQSIYYNLRNQCYLGLYQDKGCRTVNQLNEYSAVPTNSCGKVDVTFPIYCVYIRCPRPGESFLAVSYTGEPLSPSIGELAAQTNEESLQA